MGEVDIGEKDGCVLLPVHVQPRASKDAIAGEHGGAVKIRVGAAPADGAANRAVEKLLARTLGVPPSAVRVVRGLSSRRKLVQVEGVSAQDAKAALGI